MAIWGKKGKIRLEKKKVTQYCTAVLQAITMGDGGRGESIEYRGLRDLSVTFLNCARIYNYLKIRSLIKNQ